MTTKHHKLLIPDSVKLELQKQLDYIAFEQKEPELALRWLDGISEAINSLAEFPTRCPLAYENKFYAAKGLKTELRHYIYKRSFRVIFTIVGKEVRILAVKHSARSRL
jgi:plasmid stabilization system protein ParE